jgi:hypothetical protein
MIRARHHGHTRSATFLTSAVRYGPVMTIGFRPSAIRCRLFPGAYVRYVLDTWRVMRLDDNGNTFTVATKLDEADARARVDELQRRGHKQTYWCEPDPPTAD